MKLLDILNESKNNISEAKKVDPKIAGDIFARYLIGDRTDAIRQLDKLKKIAKFWSNGDDQEQKNITNNSQNSQIKLQK